MHKFCFAMSSHGDTTLGLEIVKELDGRFAEKPLYIFIRADAPAKEITDKFFETQQDLAKRVQVFDAVTAEDQEKIDIKDSASFQLFLTTHHCDYTYLGVPSSNNPFILNILPEQAILGYEFMFKSSQHPMWEQLKGKEISHQLTIGVPLSTAIPDFQECNPSITSDNFLITGHLAIDKSMCPQDESLLAVKNIETRKKLAITDDQPFIFVSSTTMNPSVDKAFLQSLIEILGTGAFPEIQVRLGLHPGIALLDTYLEHILPILLRYPAIESQFKIILPDRLKGKITAETTYSSPIYAKFFLITEVNGNEAASAATHVAQAVPGALLNEAALSGKPACMGSGEPYLPKELFFFKEAIPLFFRAGKRAPLKKEDLGLSDKSVAAVYADHIVSKLS